MDLVYSNVQNLKFTFSSEQLITIRVTTNDTVKIIQCRNTMDLVTAINLTKDNTITIENLTPDTPCNIDRVAVNYLEITRVMHEFTQTLTKEDNTQIGQFVRDIFTPDICVIKIPSTFYHTLLPYFKNKALS